MATGNAVSGRRVNDVVRWLADSGPTPVGQVAARLVAAADEIPESLARPMVAGLGRIRVEDGIAELVNPFWLQTQWVILDLETTGMAPERGSSVTEVAAWKVEGGDIVDSFVTFVDPGHAIPGKITEITGIDDAMVAGAEPWSTVIHGLHEFMGDLPWFAHNQSFDARFIDHQCTMSGLDQAGGIRLCSLRLARRLLKGGRHNLSACVERLGVRGAPVHRAEADVDATHQVILALMAQLPPEVGGWQDVRDWLDGGRKWLRERQKNGPAGSSATV